MWSHSLLVNCNNNYASVNILTTVHWLLITKHAVTFTSHQLQLSNSPSTTCRPSVTRRDHIHLSPLCNNKYASVNSLTTINCLSITRHVSHSPVITCRINYVSVNILTTVYCQSQDMWSHSPVDRPLTVNHKTCGHIHFSSIATIIMPLSTFLRPSTDC